MVCPCSTGCLGAGLLPFIRMMLSFAVKGYDRMTIILRQYRDDQLSVPCYDCDWSNSVYVTVRTREFDTKNSNKAPGGVEMCRQS